MEKTGKFYTTKILDIGTKHPVVARISSGIPELLELWQVSEDKKKQTRNYCYDIAKDLIEAEKQAMPVIREIEAIEANLEKNRPTTLPDSIESVLNLENIRVFLKFAKAALEKLANLLGIIFDKGFSKPKFEDITNALAKKFSNEKRQYFILDVLQHYQPFADKLVELRNREEHPRKRGEIFIKNYDVKERENELVLERPCFIDQTPIYEYLTNALPMLLHFVEDCLIAAISIDLHPTVAIAEIPQNQRDPEYPKRFRLNILVNSNEVKT